MVDSARGVASHEETLALLSSFRSLEDPGMRILIRTLIDAIARLDRLARDSTVHDRHPWLQPVSAHRP